MAVGAMTAGVTAMDAIASVANGPQPQRSHGSSAVWG